jgi:alkanesulfonate monooxygenase SsuD/methylene tetrahydromethanopterin reductase-like flavin-dependent oxidoreductase (luciferase family)
VRIGVALPHYGHGSDVFDRVVGVAVECEHLGFDSVWVSDHLVFDLSKYGGSAEPLGSVEPVTMLAVLARETSTVRLGTLVLCNEFRHPVQLAKEAVTVDIASGGRLELGIGAGWYEREFDASGIAYPRAGIRLDRLRESVEVLKMLFSGDTVSYRGTHYVLDEMLLRPVSRPPIWVGGKGDRAIRMIAGLGGGPEIGWNASWFQDVDAYKERAALLGGATVRRSIGQYARGSAQEMVDRLASFAGEGVELAVMCFSAMPFGLDDPDDVVRFAQDVLPHVRDL